nr:ATP-binding protein [Sagittula salina]
MRLFLILVLATGAVWLSAAFWIQTSTRAEVERVLDARLAEAARMVSSLISDERIAVARAAQVPLMVPMAQAAGYTKQLSCQIWALDGTMAGRSDGAPASRLTSAAEDGYSRSIVDGEPWRVFTLTNEALGVRVMVGDSMAVRERLIFDLIEGLLLPAALILPILALLIWVSVARGLAPLDRLAETLRARPPQDLSPLPPGAAPREIRPVRRALDSLFARLAAARETERDFTTYAAHELKTPLAGLRTQAQLLRITGDPAIREKAIAAIEKSVDRTDRMVRQLLELARVERAEFGTELTDLTQLLGETLEDLDTLARTREVSLDTETPDDLTPVETNPFLLRAALRNVVENAIHASPRAGHVRVRLECAEGQIAFVISDEGHGLTGDLRERAMERFVRGPATGPQGSGLGLSITAGAMERLGGRMVLEDSAGQGQTVRLRLT